MNKFKLMIRTQSFMTAMPTYHVYLINLQIRNNECFSLIYILKA